MKILSQLQLDLKSKLLIPTVTTTVVICAVGLFYLKHQLTEDQRVKTQAEFKALASSVSNDIQARVEVALDASRTLAHVMSDFELLPLEKRRDIFTSYLITITKNNPDFLAAWTGWEPNSLDGLDEKYRNTEGTDDTGRFIPYVNRGTGQIKIEPLVDYTVPGVGDYYLVPLRSQKEHLTPPYLYPVAGKEVLLISVCVPIVKDGQSLGVVGVDYGLDLIQKIVADIKPYQSFQIALLAHDGTIAAHTDAAKLGKKSSEFQQEVFGSGRSAELASKSSGSVESWIAPSPVFKGEGMFVSVPVQFGRSDIVWKVVVSASMSEVMATANRLVFASTSLLVLAAIVISFVIFLVSHTVSKDLSAISDTLAESANLIALDAEQMQSSSQSLAEEASEQAASLQETSASLEQIASMTKRNAENALSAKELAADTRSAAEVGAQNMNAMN
ncbi:MAG: methyl-accepting chemotaxis protein, partial [Chthoniobacterales bacterium]|nr:methyl-accepting chemotaxis protein [Chthoniobacterales bacterium]